MFNLTTQEKKVILFLSAIFLLGLGVSFFKKASSRIEKFASVNEELVRLNLNSASFTDLTSLKQIRPSLARKILDYRNSHEKFTSLEELKEVKGIGEHYYNKLEDLFFVE